MVYESQYLLILSIMPEAFLLPLSLRGCGAWRQKDKGFPFVVMLDVFQHLKGCPAVIVTLFSSDVQTRF